MNKNKAFTLIEVIVTLFILSIIMLLVMQAMNMAFRITNLDMERRAIHDQLMGGLDAIASDAKIADGIFVYSGSGISHTSLRLTYQKSIDIKKSMQQRISYELKLDAYRAYSPKRYPKASYVLSREDTGANKVGKLPISIYLNSEYDREMPGFWVVLYDSLGREIKDGEHAKDTTTMIVRLAGRLSDGSLVVKQRVIGLGRASTGD